MSIKHQRGGKMTKERPMTQELRIKRCFCGAIISGSPDKEGYYECSRCELRIHQRHFYLKTVPDPIYAHIYSAQHENFDTGKNQLPASQDG